MVHTHTWRTIKRSLTFMPIWKEHHTVLCTCAHAQSTWTTPTLTLLYRTLVAGVRSSTIKKHTVHGFMTIPQHGWITQALTLAHSNNELIYFTMNYLTDWFISFAGIYQLIELISTAPSAAITPQKRSCPPPRGNSGCDLTVGINNSENKRASIEPRCADGVISVASVRHLWRLYNISDVRGITPWVQNMPSIVEICGITCVARASVAAQIAEGSGHKRGLGGKKQCRTCNNCT